MQREMAGQQERQDAARGSQREGQQRGTARGDRKRGGKADCCADQRGVAARGERDVSSGGTHAESGDALSPSEGEGEGPQAKPRAGPDRTPCSYLQLDHLLAQQCTLLVRAVRLLREGLEGGSAVPRGRATGGIEGPRWTQCESVREMRARRGRKSPAGLIRSGVGERVEEGKGAVSGEGPREHADCDVGLTTRWLRTARPLPMVKNGRAVTGHNRARHG